jgi:hypothetical protein
MIIKIDASAFRQTRWHEYALRFVFGGAVSVAAGLIAREFGPGVGGLFLAFPAIFPAGATLVERQEKEKKERKGLDGKKRGLDAAALDAIGTAIGSLALVLFATFVWIFLSHYPAWLILTGATFVWLITAVVIWGIRRKM